MKEIISHMLDKICESGNDLQTENRETKIKYTKSLKRSITQGKIKKKWKVLRPSEETVKAHIGGRPPKIKGGKPKG